MSIAELRAKYDDAVFVEVVASSPELMSAAVAKTGDTAPLYLKARERVREREIQRLVDSMDRAWREHESWEDAVFALDGNIQSTLDRLIVQEEARARLRRLTEPPAKPWDAATLRDLLKRDPVPPARVDGVMTWEGNTLVVAQRKTGKTTFTLNLTRSLLTGEPFLGEFAVRPVEGRVGLLNFEVSGEMVAEWAHDIGVPEDRLYVVNLRGTANPFGDPERLAALAALLREQDVETLIVDPYGRAFSGDDQNNTGQATRWLSDLERFAREDVGAKDIVLVAHAGWNGERVRGASALEDWPDAILYLRRGDGSDKDNRYLEVDGRLEPMPERQLAFDRATRRLSFSGVGSRSQAKEADLRTKALHAIRDNPGIEAGELDEALGFKKGGGGAASHVKWLLGERLIRVESGGGKTGRAKRHYLADDLDQGEAESA